MSKTVLVTGITGFLGGHVALALLQKGYRVRGSLRSLSRADKVRATLGAAGADVSALDFVALDLLEDAGWSEALKGVDLLQHVASPFIARAPKHPDDLIRPAVEGTTRALDAALAANVERIVLTSSFAAIGYGQPGKSHFTAADWTNLNGPGVNVYVRSKTMAEQRAWEMMRAAGREADLATINPGMIMGPLLDEDPGTSVDLLRNLMRGSMPAAADIAMVEVDVRDVAAMHVAAMEKRDAGGKRHPGSAGTLTIRQIADIVAKAAPAYAGKMPRFDVPNWLARSVGRFHPDLKDNLGEIGNHRFLDETALPALIGRPAITPEQAIAASAESLIVHKLV